METLAPAFVKSSEDVVPSSSSTKRNKSEKNVDTSEQKILSVAGM